MLVVPPHRTGVQRSAGTGLRCFEGLVQALALLLQWGKCDADRVHHIDADRLHHPA